MSWHKLTTAFDTALSVASGLVTAVNRAAFAIAAGLVLAVMPLMLFQAISRYAFGNPAAWAGELATLLFGPMFLLAGPYLLHLRQHVGVDILTARLSERARDWLDLALMPVVIFFAVVMVQRSWPLAMNSFAFRETSFSSWNPEIWWTKFFLPVAMALLAAQAVAEMLAAVRRLGLTGARPVATTTEEGR
ncbi:MAG: TRAP transporter small permease subunit [Alkalilacustris sp.]